MWEWVCERKMGLVSRSVKSRRFPFSQLSNFILRNEQFRVIETTYGMSHEELMGNQRRNWGELSSDEMMFPELSASFSQALRGVSSYSKGTTAVLRSPIEKEFLMNEEEKQALAKCIRNRLGYRARLSDVLEALPPMALRTGKVRVLGESESICGLWAASRYSKDAKHDSSFIRVSTVLTVTAHNLTIENSLKYW